MEQYYQKEIECASREEIRAIQDEKLRKQVRHVWDNVPYYRKMIISKETYPGMTQSSSDSHRFRNVSVSPL